VGYGSAIMSSSASEVIGLDIDEETINWATDKYKNYKNYKNVSFIMSSIETLPFEDNYFDVVVSFETIEHVPDNVQNSFLKEVKRVLKDDGKLIISTPNKKIYSDQANYCNQFHIKEFYKSEFQDFLKRFFKNVELYHQNFHLSSFIYNNKMKGKISVLNDEAVTDGKYFIAVCGEYAKNEIGNLNTAFIDLQNLYLDNNNLVYNLVNKVSRMIGKLYLDFGDGFTESNSIVNYYDITSNNFEIVFDLANKEEIQKVRWDPIESVLCDVTLNKLEIINMSGTILQLSTEYLESNGVYYLNNFYSFNTLDPTLIINGEFRNAKSLRIAGEIFLKDKNSSISKYQEIIKTIELKRIDLINQNTEYCRKYEDLTRLNKELNVFNDELSKSLDDTNQLRKDIESQLLNSKKNIEDKTQYIESLVNEISDLQKNLENIIHSKSWKITAPLRQIKIFFKKIFNV
ncbi:MAG: methyltransferase domain-containing protein, partial [Bacillota bacterium]|nr:methyltransferase domain-containing protein [Bacillota bacterium]